MINKDVCKYLARKRVNENPIWCWNDSVNQVEDGVAYHVFCMKEPYYVLKLMTTYGTLEPMDKRTRSKFKCSGFMDTKYFMYMEVVEDHFFIDIKLTTTPTGGTHTSTLRELGLPNIVLIVALLGTLLSRK